MKLSKFGEKLTRKTGILQLMDDLGNALSGRAKMHMLGGGNPAHIPQMETIFRRRLNEILKNNDEFERMVGNYTTPQGDSEFIDATASYFNNTYGWNITAKNVCALGGSQTTFFFLFNMLGGEHADGSFKKILLPLVPEYIGYEDQGIVDNLFTSSKPNIEEIDAHTFKYRVDFDTIHITKDTAAICVSRPTNPTGNVVTDDEVQKLSNLAKKHNIPFIIDNAYGTPFPNIIFTKTSPFWEKHIIYVMSMSKIGMPSTRTSIVIADEEIIEKLSSINAVVSLSTATLGQHILTPFLKDGSITKMSQEIIKPYYEEKSKVATAHFNSKMDPKIPYRLHISEGALFLWLWCENLPITSMELYERLKKRETLVVPGEYFFPGLSEPWQHKSECVRITYSQNEADVKAGLDDIAETVREAYS